MFGLFWTKENQSILEGLRSDEKKSLCVPMEQNIASYCGMKLLMGCRWEF